MRTTRPTGLLRSLSVLILLAACSLALAAPITGKVVDKDGAPVAGAKVWLVVLDPFASSREDLRALATTSAADGGFSLDSAAVAPGEAGRIYAWVGAYREGLAIDEVRLTDPGKPITLTLLPPVPLTGSLLGADMVLYGGVGEWLAVKTNEAGKTKDLGTVRLIILRGTVAGRAVDEAGKPLGGARVWDSLDGPRRVGVVTDAEGALQAGGPGPEWSLPLRGGRASRASTPARS
jgi:hypothetical protein